MSLSFATRGVSAAYRIREYMARTGRTPWGDMLWTAEEEQTVKRLHPDYRAIKKALKRRTMIAIRARAGKLGLTKRIHVWTGRELTTLKRLYPRASRSEILAALPGLNWGQIDNAAQYHKLHRARQKFKPTSHDVWTPYGREPFPSITVWSISIKLPGQKIIFNAPNG